jgi:phosphoenolpyruvate synthase/pyruvate phosphate dikinase
MKMANENKSKNNLPAEASSLDSTLQALLYKLQKTPQKSDEVESLCGVIKGYLSSSSMIIEQEKIKSLLPFLETSSIDIREHLFSLFEVLIFKMTDPWKLLSELLFSQDEQSRELAAKLLDIKGTPASEQTIKKLLGNEAAKTLSHYLAYTRASHKDLLYLVPELSKSPPILKSLQQCQKICGENIIREVIAKLGWKLVNYGLSVKHYIGVTFDGSLPLYLSESEAILFEKSVKAERDSDFYLFTARGGLPLEANKADEGSKPVALFRTYNLAHANLLNEILDVAPLTRQKVKNIIEQLDKIVDDFIKLFKSYTEECTILPEVYGKIKSKIVSGLNTESSSSHLSTDVTRLVQMFEDPHTIGEVHTLHGLKRYLHQVGLQLGFKLVDQSRSPNQSINLVLASGNKILSVIQNINFADFESRDEEEFSFSKIPYPIRVVIEGFERQLLHGQESFPSVNIFCYGNEVHYFVWFRNHPVFIRIDFSPPLQGGMIDLQYFGVSNYEIADHPNIYLDSIRYFLQHLEFDIKMDGTHIQARYDKERALDLSQLCERVEYLFCLVPYLMDLDWVIGSLNLGSNTKKKVAKAWAELFTRWAVLPINKLLTKDRLGILQDVLKTPEGEYELVWKGEDEYQDRFTTPISVKFFENIFDTLNILDLKIPKFSVENFNQISQIQLEKKLLNYLREALAEGQIIETDEGFVRAPRDLFQRIHEAYWFSEIISLGGKDFESSVTLAKAIIPLEQTLKFKDTGTLESFKVQTSSLPLAGKNLTVYALRDYKGIIRLGFFVCGNSLYQRRKNKNDPWKTNANLSAIEFMSLLRYNNYNVAGLEPSAESIKEEVQKFHEELQLHKTPVLQPKTPGEKIVNGLRASPGRATGRVLLGVEGRLPEDFNDNIFVAASVSPDENTILFHSAGIVATGGGILSHAGLIATQFNKPAIIISGKWKREEGGSLVLNYKTSEYKVEHKEAKGFNITIYYDLQEQEHQMRDGDLVVLDANEGSLQVLGQERDTIALFEELKSLGRTNENISRVDDVKELLVLRGKKLHIRHQIEKLLKRIADSSLAKYAVKEIMVGNFLVGDKSTPEEKAHLLTIILQNDKIGDLAESYLSQTAIEIENKFTNAYVTAEKNIPLAKYPFEVVIPRLEVLRIYKTMKDIFVLLGVEHLQKIKIEMKEISDINEISIHRFKELRKNIVEKIQPYLEHIEKREFVRHLFRQLNRIELLLNASTDEQLRIKKLLSDFEIDDEVICGKLANKFILKAGDGTLELSPLMGWKAANLAELEMLGGEGLVPPWFVISDKAFQITLETSIKENVLISGDSLLSGISLREAIDKIILRTDINNREKSLHIGNLWNMISLPEEIKKEVLEAYHQMEKQFLTGSTGKEKESGFYVALRSSSCEEDAEIAARAGEFETYLFITGEDLLIEYLKKTWSGLWTERAIHNRSVLGNKEVGVKGGVIVQRIVWSRVSGVLQTINVAKGELKEIVINAGLGLGEGVVSGAVAADQIVVSKEGDLENGHLQFNYVTADKTEQVVFNKRAGFGTILSSTLYHQRFRSALEYVELCELVSVASRLEAAYGYPLDIEFGIEGTKLWILQVRPVATFLPAFRETLSHYPLIEKNNIRTTQEKLK